MFFSSNIKQHQRIKAQTYNYERSDAETPLHRNYLEGVIVHQYAIAWASVIRKTPFEVKTIDSQVIVRAIIMLVTFIVCAYLYRLWVRRLADIDKFFMLLFCLLILLSSVYAQNPFISAVAAFSVIVNFSLLVFSASVLDTRSIIKTISAALVLISVVSIVVYFAIPDLGRMKIWQPGGIVNSKRLTGVTGTPIQSAIKALSVSCCCMTTEDISRKCRRCF